ncbi:hypothetical protein ASE04_06045 [Rhizobium sp. Root708]|uniref:hypothetical protein n=1 Tax=Rhizobium sp. Root708 TaxID=1736592 RepID=UPI0006FC9AC5|nr:hypothetical protein [Rhizobium sp. Root708]KRB55263.1 hypothetical protein ASE04_06045 [Rhizobium sp. Root708]
MISAIALARSYSTRLALGVLQNNSTTETNTSPTSKLLTSLGFDNSGSTRLNSKTLAAILQALQNQGDEAGGETQQHTTGSIGSKDFMTKLKVRLGDSSSEPMSYVNNQEMLKALKDGTLTVTNPATGETVSAYEPNSTNHASKPEKGDPKAWNKFLDEHLKRDAKGNFVKSADGSYIDAKTGQNAYFEKVDGSYYYFTWPGKMSADV